MTIHQLVNQLVQKHETKDPFRISAEKKIVVLFEPLGNMMGYFNTYKRIPMIHINQNLSEEEQRFTCAHELGHALLHRHINTPFLKRHTLQCVSGIENEANEFAMSLLLHDELKEYGCNLLRYMQRKGIESIGAHGL